MRTRFLWKNNPIKPVAAELAFFRVTLLSPVSNVLFVTHARGEGWFILVRQFNHLHCGKKLVRGFSNLHNVKMHIPGVPNWGKPCPKKNLLAEPRGSDSPWNRHDTNHCEVLFYFFKTKRTQTNREIPVFI